MVKELCSVCCVVCFFWRFCPQIANGKSKVKPTCVTQIGQGIEPPCKSPRKTHCQKEELGQRNAKAELQEIRTEIEALKLSWKVSLEKTPSKTQREEAGGRDKEEETRDTSRSVECQTCTANGTPWCNHCFKCGSENHYAIGCRQGESAGQKPLNNRLLTRDQK